jgi:PadR family transcriptional regulator, regulatory protein PadR
VEARSNDYWEMLISRSAQRFFLLFALHERPMHGYELARTIREVCGGCCDPTDAMIYPTLRDLVDGAYVDCTDEVVAGRRRKVCRLTDKGEEAYRAAATAWQHMLGPLNRAVDAALKPSGKKAVCCGKAAAKGDPK